MRAARVLGRTVTVHVRFADFRVVQRSATLRSPTDATGDVHASAVKSLRAMRLDRPRIRRVGVRVEGLVNAETAYQQPMLGEPDHGWRDAERAADAAVSYTHLDVYKRQVFVHPSGFVQNPYTDIAPAGESPKTVPHRKLWHSSQGSSGW